MDASVLQWWEIRDLLTGRNFRTRNEKRAFDLARLCSHPDAKWLVEACAKREIRTSKDVLDAILDDDPTDPRMLCFSGAVEEAAKLGYAYAQTLVADSFDVEWDRLAIVQNALRQNERDAHYVLAHMLLNDEVVAEADYAQAGALFKAGAELGHVASMVWHAHRLQGRERWIWLSRAAVLGNSWAFLYEFVAEVSNWNAPVVFLIGQTLSEHLSVANRTIFGEDAGEKFAAALSVVQFYKKQIKSAREAVDTWTRVAIRFRVVKDIRILIGKLIWTAREEANYS